MTKAEFKKLVENGPVILDGATGTNLQKAGMPVGVCPEQWILENPDIMIKLQEDYVAAGTDILYAPTFTANRIKLEEYGLADRLEEMNRELIALSQKAAQGKALVAADMTMTGQQLYPLPPALFPAAAPSRHCLKKRLYGPPCPTSESVWYGKAAARKNWFFPRQHEPSHRLSDIFPS